MELILAILLELFLVVLTIAVFVAGYKIGFKDNEIGMGILFSVTGLVIIGLCIYLGYYINYEVTSYKESEPMIIQIDNKKTDTNYNPSTKITETDYYFYWDENRVEVSSKIYYKYNIGDEFIVNKVYVYKKGSEELRNIEYYAY